MEVGKHIIQKLMEHNHEAYFIGGCVRDFLLGRKSLDIDIVTSASPDEIITIFKDYKTDLVGKSFGVVIVDGIDVATYRTDVYSESTDMTVRFASSLEEDVSRRDFTINSIAMDINGNFIDYNNGMKHIQNGIIKFIGNPAKRIEEDPNRIIRAARFKAALNGTFDGKTVDTLVEKSNDVKLISPERIYKELTKVMKVRKASQFFTTCYQINILHHILPKLYNCIGYEQNRFHNEPLFTHNMIVGDSVSIKYPLVKLAGYLHDVGKPDSCEFNEEKQDKTFLRHEELGAEIVKTELGSLKFSNDEVDKISNLVRLHMRTFSSPKACRKIIKDLTECSLSVKDLLRLKLGDFKGKNYNRSIPLSIAKEIVNNTRLVYQKNEPFSLKQLAVNGNDIMTNLNLQPGPIIGKVLNSLLEIVLEDPQLNIKEILMEKMKEFMNDTK